jgi:hypothetical protein
VARVGQAWLPERKVNVAHHPRRIVAVLAGLVMIVGLLEASPPTVVRAATTGISEPMPPGCTIVATGLVLTSGGVGANVGSIVNATFIAVTTGTFVSFSAVSGILIAAGATFPDGPIQTFTSATFGPPDSQNVQLLWGMSSPWQYFPDGSTVAECFIAGQGGTPPAPPRPAVGPTVARIDPPEGPYYGGTKVTITGTGLTGASVTFGGVAATITSQSETSISVASPRSLAGPSATALRTDVTVTTAGGTATSANAFTYRGVAVVLMRGWTSSWPPGPDAPDEFWQTGGIVQALQANNWPPAALLEFSYKPGTSVEFGTAYSACDTLGHIVDAEGQLNTELTSYAARHPDIDVYLIGHSQGGVVALGYLAYLAKTGRGYSTPVPGTHLAGIVTLDSPLGGVGGLTFTETTLVQDTLRIKCASAGTLSPDFQDFLQLAGQLPFGWPSGGTRSIPKLFGIANAQDNQSVVAAAAQVGVPTLTVGNTRDLSFASSGIFSTQWVADGGDNSGVFARVMNKDETCITWDLFCHIAHGAVLTDTSVQAAILDLFNGKTPGFNGKTPGLSVPTSPWVGVASEVVSAVGGVVSMANGLISLVVPAASVASPGAVSLSAVPLASLVDPVPSGQILAGPAISVTMPPLTAGASAQLTLPIDLTAVPAGSSVAIYQDGVWTKVPTALDRQAGLATATIAAGGIYAPLTFPLTKVTLDDRIAIGTRRGTSGFTTGTVAVGVGSSVTYLVITKPSLAGKSLTIWSRVGTGAWRKITARAVASDGTVHYYARVRSRTTFRATWAGDGATAPATSPGRTVRTR